MITEKLELSDNVHFSITWIPTQPRSSHENEKIGHFHKSLDPAHSWENHCVPMHSVAQSVKVLLNVDCYKMATCPIC